MMSRFFIEQKHEIGENVFISGDDAHHIIKVLRHKPGDKLMLSDGKNTESIVIIEEIDYKGMQVKTKVVENNNIKGVSTKISLYQGLPKSTKFDLVLQKNTEIGISRFIPVITERTVTSISSKKSESKLKRWRRIVKEACKQCMRPDIPEVCDIIQFEKAVDLIKDYDLAIIPWEHEEQNSLKNLLKKTDIKAEEIAIFIGPEGGFTKQEIESAQKAGAFSVSLGPRILRTETAAVVVSSIMMYELGDLGGQICLK
jgi:16S rRNA (uracil1498-N3)-methyltransferase